MTKISINGILSYSAVWITVYLENFLVSIRANHKRYTIIYITDHRKWWYLSQMLITLFFIIIPISPEKIYFFLRKLFLFKVCLKNKNRRNYFLFLNFLLKIFNRCIYRHFFKHFICLTFLLNKNRNNYFLNNYFLFLIDLNFMLWPLRWAL